MKIPASLILAALVCAAQPLRAQYVLGGRTLLQVANAPNGVVLALDSGSIARTADSTFLATWVWRFPPATASRYGLDTELQHNEMNCARTRIRRLRKWALKDDVPVATEAINGEGSDATAADSAWQEVGREDASPFGVICRYLLDSFAATLPVRTAMGTPPELVNREELWTRVGREYPENMRRQRKTGTAMLRLRITAEGAVDTTQTSVVRASEPEFQAAALRIVPHLRFRPATRSGQPVPVWLTWTLFFTLDTNSARRASEIP